MSPVALARSIALGVVSWAVLIGLGQLAAAWIAS